MADESRDPLSIIRRILNDHPPCAGGEFSGVYGNQPEELENRRGRVPKEAVLELTHAVPVEEPLISLQSAAASRKALAVLASTYRQQKGASSQAASKDPLETIVRDMLQPMVKDWLDERLPEIVEDMVTRKIARMSRTGF
jgi:cell pole-organizing protein PopZ